MTEDEIRSMTQEDVMELLGMIFDCRSDIKICKSDEDWYPTHHQTEIRDAITNDGRKDICIDNGIYS